MPQKGKLQFKGSKLESILNKRMLVKRNVAEISKEQEEDVEEAMKQQADLVALDIMEKMKYQLGRSNLVDELD